MTPPRSHTLLMMTGQKLDLFATSSERGLAPGYVVRTYRTYHVLWKYLYRAPSVNAVLFR
jgi:hypothetical protein